MVSLAFLVPYVAVALIILVFWALACLMYGAVRSGTSAKVTFVVGLLIIVGTPLVIGTAVVLLKQPRF